MAFFDDKLKLTSIKQINDKVEGKVDSQHIKKRLWVVHKLNKLTSKGGCSIVNDVVNLSTKGDGGQRNL